jgi:hypothetical protein
MYEPLRIFTDFALQCKFTAPDTIRRADRVGRATRGNAQETVVWSEFVAILLSKRRAANTIQCF